MTFIDWLLGESQEFQQLRESIDIIHNQGVRIMADLAALTQKVSDLEASEAAREQRDIAQDAVTSAQIATLQATVEALNQGPSDQAAIDAIASRITAVITSLDAADPTPPVVP